MKHIAVELARQAKKKGICKQWYHDLKETEETEKLIDLYLRGIDFCLSNDYPTNDYIRANFKGKMEPYGIHLDEALNEVNKKKVIALGICTGKIEASGFIVSEVFVKHNSELEITASENSFVMVDIFDNSVISIVASGNAKVCINRYGGMIEVKESENAMVKIVEKNKKTY